MAAIQEAGPRRRIEVEEHLILDLWNMPNPFYTNDEFLEVSVNHFSLVGEMWWVIVRDKTFRIPVEIWPVRPDRMRPIPHPTDYISGYVYQVGNEKVFLDIEDVIFIRRPSPLDPYRGIGPIGSIMLDLGSEKAAAQFTANFFRNSAIPGGVIETDETMSDPDRDRLIAGWRAAHQGVGNAWRVAILEKAHWKERMFTQRDMQLDLLRKQGRDIIFGVYGVSKTMMGGTDDVNRANAEAAEVVFARWTVTPLLSRIKAAINGHLVKPFDPTLSLTFKDPVPANREFDLKEGVEGYRAGMLTLNEARARLNEGEVEDGDEFREQPTAPAFQLVTDSDGTVRKALSPPVEKDGNPLYPDEVNREESRMERAWAKRLTIEGKAIAAFVGQDKFKIETFAGANHKIEPSDLVGYDWDWWSKYSDDVIDELVEVYAEAMLAVGTDVPEIVLQRLASEWATQRGAQLLRLDGDINIVAQTRARVNQLVSESPESAVR
ncbi:MAG: phage portal protein [Chloroflexi bacterium]|nr:phage portal protein [Chloroflexota bacterium]